MNETALHSKVHATREAFAAPHDDLLPLRWSIPVWLVLAAASWAAVYGLISLIL